MATTATSKKVSTRISPRKQAADLAAAPETKKVRAPRSVVTKTMAPVEEVKKAAAKTKTTEPVVTKAARTVMRLFVLIQGARPSSGYRLWSHTQAVLEVLGMDTGKTVKKNALVSIIGARAVDYHTGILNMQERGGAVALTDTGKRVFTLRKSEKTYKPALTEAYKAMLLRGKENAEFNIVADNMVQVGLAVS